MSPYTRIFFRNDRHVRLHGLQKNSQFTEKAKTIAGVMQDRLYFYQNESPASSACRLKDSQCAKNWDNALLCILAFIKRSASTCWPK